MKIYSALLLIFFAGNVFAQDNPFETNDEGKAYYSDVTTVSGASADVLFTRSVEWLNQHFTNPTGVLQLKDEANKTIEGKSRFRLNTLDKKGNQLTGGGFVAYQFRILCKDGRYKYEIDRIRWEKPSYYDVTQWLDKSQVGYDEAIYNFYIQQTIEHVEALIDSMNEYMQHGKEVKKDEW